MFIFIGMECFQISSDHIYLTIQIVIAFLVCVLLIDFIFII